MLQINSCLRNCLRRRASICLSAPQVNSRCYLNSSPRYSGRLDDRNTYVKLLFIDHSSLLIILVPSKLIIKLQDLGLCTSHCNWILDAFIGRPHSVWVGGNVSSSLTTNKVHLKVACPDPWSILFTPTTVLLSTTPMPSTNSLTTWLLLAESPTLMSQLTRGRTPGGLVPQE